MKKRILILCDGTWNNFEMRYITNVGRMAQILEPEGRSGRKNIPQVIYYDDGVASDESGLKRMWNGAFGGGLERNIYEAYRFLVFNYEKGDEVCLFGFSRGAYTVRSLAGMIGRVGLTPLTEMKHLPDAMAAYRGTRKEQETFMKRTGSRPIDITLLGCWDTVGARGIPDKVPWLSIDEFFKKKYSFHNTRIGPHIKNALHAVAIHERRLEFAATLMKKSPDAPETQFLKQIWFPGDHGCVGGGSWEKRGLSNRCLRWMLEECDALGVKLGAKMERLKDQSIEDCSIYFDNEVNMPYSTRERTIPASFEEIDVSARRRYWEIEESRKGQLKKRFSNELNDLGLPDLKQPLQRSTHLQVGETAQVRVFAREKANASNIAVNRNERYKLTVARTQVWKDGKLDPCDILGWNLLPSDRKGSKRPWEDGKPADLNLLEKKLVKAATKKRLVPEADWFELVMSLDGKNFIPLGFKKPAKKTEDFTVTYKASDDGELCFTANDLSSSFGLIDKYDNNSGWIWLEVERLS